MPQRYYYCCSLPLEPGSVIKPGNWGRILKKYTPQTSPNPWLFVRELVFESVRREAYPHKPNRFDAIFLCLTENDLIEFRDTNNRRLDIAYEIEVMDETAPSHIGDLSLANMANTDDYHVFENRARLYWQGENIVKQELITAIPIRIIRLINR